MIWQQNFCRFCRSLVRNLSRLKNTIFCHYLQNWSKQMLHFQLISTLSKENPWSDRFANRPIFVQKHPLIIASCFPKQSPHMHWGWSRPKVQKSSTSPPVCNLRPFSTIFGILWWKSCHFDESGKGEVLSEAEACWARGNKWVVLCSMNEGTSAPLLLLLFHFLHLGFGMDL